MSALLRYAGFALVVLLAALVLTLCGEGVACAECFHACCERSDRPDGLRTLLTRVADALGLGAAPRPIVPAAYGTTSTRDLPAAHPALLALETSALRI